MRKKKSQARRKTAAPRLSRTPPLPAVVSKPPGPDIRAWGLLLGWALTAFAFINSPSFRLFFLPPNYSASGIPFGLIYLLGLGLILYFLPRLSEDFPAPDLSPRMAHVLFWAVMVGASYQRLKDAHLLPSMAWDDHWIIISQVRSVMDYSDYHLLFGHDFRPPFVTYFMCGLWALLPHETGIFIVRLASTLMDLGAFWILYLAGKELGGRRMGLVLMAMGAFSKPLLETTKYDLGINEVALVAALVILFLLRVLRDPSLKHFLQLGAAMGFTDYTYSTLRIFIPAVIFGTLAWIIWDSAKRPRSRYGWLLGPGLAVSWAALFLTHSTFITHNHPWVGFFTKGPGGLAVLAFLAFCYFQVWRKRTSEGKIWEWASAVFFTGILLTPLWMDPHYSVENNLHLSNQALWGTYYHFTFPEIVSKARSNFAVALQFMFGNTNGLGGHPFLRSSDCFMDYFMPLFGIVGLVSIAMRPRWWKIALLTLLAVGFVPAVLTPEVLWQHLLVTLVPLYVVSAWGTYLLWSAAARAFPRRGPALAGLLLAGFGVLFFLKDAQWVDQWESRRSADLISADIIDRNLTQDRVYLAPSPGSFVLIIQDLLCEGKEIYCAQPFNEIDLAPGQEGKDLAVITYVGDTATQEKLKEEFPRAPWFEGKDFQGLVTLKWVVVPFNQIPDTPGKFFYVKRTPGSFGWRRRYFSPYGIARGMIHFEDRQARWNDALPPQAQGSGTVEVTGNWKVTEEGDYLLEARTANILEVLVDGREVLGVRAGQGDRLKRARLHLFAGDHAVLVRTALIQDIHIPPVLVTSLKAGWKKDLDELAEGPVETAPTPAPAP